MESIRTDGNDVVRRSNGFWKRQFQAEATSSQRKFDWAFGVVIPTLCCLLDPLVFRGNFLGVAIFAAYKPFAYVLSFASIMAMAAFLLWGERLRGFNAPISGLFLAGATVCLAVGIVLLPFSLLGLLLLIGALGFTPLFSSVVYLRNARRAFCYARVSLPTGVLVRTAALGAIFAAIVPITINREVQRSIDGIIHGDPAQRSFAAKKLEILAPLVNFDQLALHIRRTSSNEQPDERRQFIADFYQRMTGRSVETVNTMMD